MSKGFVYVSLIFATLLFAVTARSQDIEATIAIDFKLPVACVDGRSLAQKSKNLSFLRTMPGNEALASRISGLELFDVAGRPVNYKKLMDGEYLADAEIRSWSYKVDLTPSKNRSSAAHASWFASGSGILMLADLLPLRSSKSGPSSAKISFATPLTGSSVSPPPIFSTEPKQGDVYLVPDTENSVFYVGDGWQPQMESLPGLFLVSGKWNFDASDVSSMTAEILEYYAKHFGSTPAGRPSVAIARFPQPSGFGNWEAETRGQNVIIISSDMPFKTQSLQRLHEQLRHELFHLWIPNGVNLTGNYDWFYEGFALYRSLKLAVELNRIRFGDLLDTLSRAHTIDSAGRPGRSLLQASANRFSGAETQIYARGMLVAFLVDLALLKTTNGKRSVEDLLRELHAKHKKPAEPADGNTAVLELLRSNPSVADIVDKYVTGVEKMEWAGELSAAGIVDSDSGMITTLKVIEKPSGRQRTLLDRLGYNNWRKLSRNPK